MLILSVLISCSPKYVGPNEKYTVDNILNNNVAPPIVSSPIVSSPVVIPVFPPDIPVDIPIDIPAVIHPVYFPPVPSNPVIVSSDKNTYFNDKYGIFFDFPVGWTMMNRVSKATIFGAMSSNNRSTITVNEGSTLQEISLALSSSNSFNGLKVLTSKKEIINGISGEIKTYSFTTNEKNSIVHDCKASSFSIVRFDKVVFILACYVISEGDSVTKILRTIRTKL